tara:strand:+ start:300 stop:1070 length:771 start_codon:yes stop_codon:yes gene_type:complete
MDFTIYKYISLIESLLEFGYSFQTFENYIVKPNKGKVVILRYDVDKCPENSLRISKVNLQYNIKGSFYFRFSKDSWNEKIIKEIHSYGNEIGYHYESLTTCKGDIDKAFLDFKMNLDKLRGLVKVKTICMHGSPMSIYDSKDIWSKYDYRDLGILGEPYYDLDFNHLFYITDTGRMWDGYNYSVRDKIENYQKEWNSKGLVFHNTNDIINSLRLDSFPGKVMFTMHPQRWHENRLLWFKELLMQNIKNQIKRLIVK